MRFPSVGLKSLLAVASALALTIMPTAHGADVGRFPLPTAATGGTAIPVDPPVCTPVAPVDHVSVSDGNAITPADIAAFDGWWMKPEVCASWLQDAEDAHKKRQHGWAFPDRMLAMGHLFELTHDERYLKHLRHFIELALRYRDDHYPGTTAGERACPRCEPMPIDDFRGGHVAGWGGIQDEHGVPMKVTPSGKKCLHDLCSGISEDLTGQYAQGVAAFARIVTEDPSLQAAYGADAVRYANEALKTMWALMPQMQYRPVGNFSEGYVADITHHRLSDGRPLEYNGNAAVMMMLMELWRALDSPFYRQSAPQPLEAEPSRVLIPVLVSRFQRHFSNRLQTWTDTPNGSPRFHWTYGEDPDEQYAENQHSVIDMRYIDMLRRNFERLNARAAPLGEPIAFDSSFLGRFVDTFVFKIAEVPWTFGGSNLAQDVDGRGREPKQNGNCKGWVNLAVADPDVYNICRDVTVRFVNGNDGGTGESAFSIGMHSEVLMN